MLTVKLDNVNMTSGAGKERSLVNVFQRMLRTVHGYAKDTSSKVYLYVNVQDVSNVNFVPLFFIDEKIFTMNSLHTARVVGTEGSFVDLDFDDERKMSLHQYLGQDFFTDVLPELKRMRVMIPSQMWCYYDIATDESYVECAYDFSTVKKPVEVEESVNKWIRELESPEEKIRTNVFDNRDLLGEDFMLEL